MVDDANEEVTEEEEEESAVAVADGEDGDDDEFEFVEDPTFEIDYKGECAYEVKVSVPTANEKKQAEEMFEELKHDAELPGFRKGRVPIKLIEKKFSKAVKNEVSAKMVGAAFKKLVEDEDLKPAGYPDIDGLDEDGERSDGDPLEFTLKFEVAPRVELGKYRGIEVERPVVNIDAKDIDEAIKDILENQATYEAMKKGKAKAGDQVIMDFKGTVDGEDFKGGAAENYPYILGSKRFFPEFEEVLKGSTTNDELECKVTFPEDYPSEDVRGKTADFTIKVNEVKRKKVPKLTEELAKEMSHDSVEAMRTSIEDQLKERTVQQSSQVAEMRAMEQIVEGCTFEIPKSLIDRVSRDHQEQQLRALIQQGLPREQFQEAAAKIHGDSDESAIRSIKTMVALNEIAEAEGIDVTEEDLDKEAATISESMGAELEQVAQYIKGNEQRSAYIDRIYRSKTMAVVMENATVTEKELTREEMEEVEGNDEE